MSVITRLGGKYARAVVLVGMTVVPLVGVVVVLLVGVVVVPLVGVTVVPLMGVVGVPFVGVTGAPLMGVAGVLLVGVARVPVMGGVDGMAERGGLLMIGEIVLAPPIPLERTGDGVGTVIPLRGEGDPLLVGVAPRSGGEVGVAVPRGSHPVGTGLEDEGTGTGVVAPPPRDMLTRAIRDDSSCTCIRSVC